MKETTENGGEVLQICDCPLIEPLNDDELVEMNVNSHKKQPIMAAVGVQ